MTESPRRATRIFFSCAIVSGALFGAVGCGQPPPASQVPSARAALDRVHAMQDCGLGIHANAKIDHFGSQGRVRGDLLMYALWPARLRMDVVGPVNVGIVATLATDANAFSLIDLREKRFLYGPASACNIARLTTVPMPGHVLVSLLRGEAPILKHEPAAESMHWNGNGYYELNLKSPDGTAEEIHIALHPDDMAKPWTEQRLRVVDVEVRREGVVFYHAEMDEHAPAKMSVARVDPDHIDPDLPPSGPACTAELPRRIHVEVPSKEEDVQFRYEDVTWNPPLDGNLFRLAPPPGMPPERVECE